MIEEKVKIMLGFEESMMLDDYGNPRPVHNGTIEISKAEYDKLEKAWNVRMEMIEMIGKLMKEHKITPSDLGDAEMEWI